MTNFRIRPLQSEDIPTLARLDADIFSMPWSEQAYAELLTHDYCLYLVAELDGVPVGCVGLVMLGTEGDIDNVFVEESSRGRGIASEMLQKLLAEARSRGIREFTLEVRESNLQAIRLYEKLGFRSEGIRPGYYEKPVEDAVIMWLREMPDAGE